MDNIFTFCDEVVFLWEMIFILNLSGNSLSDCRGTCKSRRLDSGCIEEARCVLRLTDDEIIAEVKKYPAVTVVLTGGEPSLWIDDTLIDRLHEAGKYVTVETNGTNPLPESVDWVTCSPKQGAKPVISRMDEVKVVYEGQDITVYELLPAGHFFLQPCSCSNVAETVACVMQHPKWRLSLQTHKLIDIR